MACPLETPAVLLLAFAHLQCRCRVFLVLLVVLSTSQTLQYETEDMETNEALIQYDNHHHHDHYHPEAILANKIISLPMLTTGIFGNVMLIKMTLCGGLSSAQPLNYYVMAQSVSDSLLLLLSLVPKWLEAVILQDHKLRPNLPCNLKTNISLAMFAMSSWFLVALTVSRALAVCRPHNFRSTLSRKALIAAIIPIVAFSATLSVLIVKFYSYPLRCSFGRNAFYNLSTKGRIIVGIYIFVIPIMLMVVSNSVMIKHFVDPRAKENLTLITVISNKGLQANINKIKTISSISSRQNKQSVMLKLKRQPQLLAVIVTSVIFSISFSPMTVIEILNYFRIYEMHSLVLEIVMSHVIYLNATMKFYISLLTSTTLRSKLKYLCCKIKYIPQSKTENFSGNVSRSKLSPSVSHISMGMSQITDIDDGMTTKKLSAVLSTSSHYRTSFSRMELGVSALGSHAGRGIRQDAEDTEDTECWLVRQHRRRLLQSFCATTKTETARAVNDDDHSELVQPTATTTTTTTTTAMTTTTAANVRGGSLLNSVHSDVNLPLLSTNVGVSPSACLFQDTPLPSPAESDNDEEISRKQSSNQKSLICLAGKYMKA